MASFGSINQPNYENKLEFQFSSAASHSSSIGEVKSVVDINSSISKNEEAERNYKNDHVFLTWEDLSVKVSSGGKHGSRFIIQGLTGYVRPGQFLAIMGPSGCGKSTFLDALAGRLGSNTRQSGNILINGRKQTLAYGTSAYVTQDDALLTTLTVGEAIYYSAQLQLPNNMTLLEKRERSDMTIREMGLQDCVNTRIGGWGTKGISGGQKRRVSICMEILTRPKLLFLDEPTSGLDSAASYYVMRGISSLNRAEERTIITSIHQPSSDVFALFDSLCLLSSGKTIYFGPARSANEFFAVNGFPCQTLQNPSDHFLKIINKDFDEDIEQGSSQRIPTEEVIEILANSYKCSANYQDILRQVDEISKKKSEELEKRTRASFVTQSLVLTRRSFVNMYRDLGYYWFRLAIYLTLASGLGTIFFNVGSTYASVQPRASMIMFVASFLTFMSIGGFPSFVEDMKVFERERLNGHFGSTAFVIGNTLSSIPYLLLVSIFPGAIAYYLTGLRQGFDHFAYFGSVLFVCMMLVESQMMIVASIVPNFLTGIITGAGIQAMMILGGGFFRLPHDLPGPFWKYPVYYIAFHHYAFQGLYKNEFEGLSYGRNEGGKSEVISGDHILRDIWQVELGYSKWINLLILFGMVVLYRWLFLAIIKSGEKIRPAVSSFMSSWRKNTKQVMMNVPGTS